MEVTRVSFRSSQNEVLHLGAEVYTTIARVSSSFFHFLRALIMIRFFLLRLKRLSSLPWRGIKRFSVKVKKERSNNEYLGRGDVRCGGVPSISAFKGRII